MEYYYELAYDYNQHNVIIWDRDELETSFLKGNTVTAVISFSFVSENEAKSMVRLLGLMENFNNIDDIPED